MNEKKVINKIVKNGNNDYTLNINEISAAFLPSLINVQQKLDQYVVTLDKLSDSVRAIALIACENPPSAGLDIITAWNTCSAEITREFSKGLEESEALREKIEHFLLEKSLKNQAGGRQTDF